MSDVEEEVKSHPCDKYNIPDCPGKLKMRIFKTKKSQFIFNIKLNNF